MNEFAIALCALLAAFAIATAIVLLGGGRP